MDKLVLYKKLTPPTPIPDRIGQPNYVTVTDTAENMNGWQPSQNYVYSEVGNFSCNVGNVTLNPTLFPGAKGFWMGCGYDNLRYTKLPLEKLLKVGLSFSSPPNPMNEPRINVHTGNNMLSIYIDAKAGPHQVIELSDFVSHLDNITMLELETYPVYSIYRDYFILDRISLYKII
ncbi:uncharacterized protein LOC110849730 [Folsomia candida]|uniref:Uncharacterized protein n=1 Tax=Folsomia candida TaxID=158441 RepID=A0A226ECV3_FOLCA|nr:uncharacterized protein LOC110849730 [Folsomia candida]OXA54887.1 hypothetical protein Fcan01_10117 [Folsomia candida]